MAELTCQQCRPLAAELALNVLPARERGHALRHLEHCVGCRQAVRELASTADELVELLPEAQPPADFERRVIAALTTPSRPRPRVRTGAAALLGAVLLIAVGWWGDTARQPAVAPGAPPDERVVRYAPLLSQDQQVGQVYFYPGNPPWIYLSLASVSVPTPGGSVHCEVVRRDGSTAQLGELPVAHGQGSWAGPAPAPPDALVAARLVDRAGHTVAIARFSPPPPPPAPPADAHAVPVRHEADRSGQDAGTQNASGGRAGDQGARRDRDQSDQGGSDRNTGQDNGDHDKTDKTDQASGDRDKTDQASGDHGKSDRERPNQAKSDQGKTDQGKTDQGKTDQGKTDQGKTGSDRATSAPTRTEEARPDRNGSRDRSGQDKTAQDTTVRPTKSAAPGSGQHRDGATKDQRARGKGRHRPAPAADGALRVPVPNAG